MWWEKNGIVWVVGKEKILEKYLLVLIDQLLMLPKFSFLYLLINVSLF